MNTKKVTMIVGETMYKNYLEESNNTTFKNYYKDLNRFSLDEKRYETGRVNYLKPCLQKWIDKSLDSPLRISAEIQALYELIWEYQAELEVHFLTSDTILSDLACEVIVENWGRIFNNTIIEFLPPKTHFVKNLQKDRNSLKEEGLYNLINIVRDISPDIVVITDGGIPMILASVDAIPQKCTIYCALEKKDEIEIIKIPKIKKIYVTRHPDLGIWLQAQFGNGEIISHVEDSSIFGRDVEVYGVLPTNLIIDALQKGSPVYQVGLPNISPEKRGKELSLSEMLQAGIKVLRIKKIEFEEV